MYDERFNEFVDEVNVKENSVRGSFTSPLPNFLCVTLKAPQRKDWVNKLAHHQKTCYSKWFDLMCNQTAPMALNKHSRLVFEYYKSGHVHAHGLVYFDGNYAIQGIIADMAKIWMRCQKLCYKAEKYYPQWDRYTDDSICIQYRDTVEKQLEWISYITKDEGKFLN